MLYIHLKSHAVHPPEHGQHTTAFSFFSNIYNKDSLPVQNLSEKNHTPCFNVTHNLKGL